MRLIVPLAFIGLALAPAASAREVPQLPAEATCIAAPVQQRNDATTIRPTSAEGESPCPRFLSTVPVKRVHTAQRT